MTTRANLSPAFTQLFEAEVHQAYQGAAVLTGAARTRTGVVGSTVNFPKVGKGQASVRTPGTDVVPLNTSFSSVSCTLTDFSASEYSDIFLQNKINFDERRELAQVVGSAIGRRQDQIILDALAAASAGSTVANTVNTSGSSASDLNIAKIIAAKKAMDAKNVPTQNRHMIIHANNLAGLLGDERAISGDFQNIRALVSGELNTMMGFQFHILGDRDEGGLSIDASNDRTCFAFHQSALGVAVGMPASTEINYIAEKTSFLVTAKLSMGSIAIDTDGIVDVVCREA